MPMLTSRESSVNKKKSKGPGSQAKATATKDKPPATPTTAAGTGRIWLFRLAALTLVPLLFLGTVELALRIGGYGYPTRFLLKREINGHSVYVENDKFGWRFFPRAVARSPAPLVLPARKSTNTFRIFLLGESAALGDPEPAYGFGRYLEVLLRDRYPDTRFEVVCLAMTAIYSHAIRSIARECVRHEGDLWVIYMGNNEMEGPFGAGATFGPRAPNLTLIRASLAMKTTKLGQRMDALVDRPGGRAAVNRSWAGMKMFLDGQNRHDDPARRRVYSHFEKNLGDILTTAQWAGVPVVLSTVASNLKDCAPFASLNSTNMPDELKVVWDRHYKEGKAFETAGQFALALDQYAQAARIDPDYAELHFRMGRVHLSLNNFDQAQRSFERARDFDALPFRSDSRINEIIQTMAARNGVRLLDFEKVLAEDSTNSIPGSEQFFEHVHLNFHGNYLLARAVAEQVAALLPKPIGKPGKESWATSEECERRLALTDWNRFAVLQTVVQRISDAPFTNQLDHSIRYEKYFDQLVTLKTRMTPENADEARQFYREALARAPEDFRLHEKHGEFLESTGDLSEATSAWKRAAELIPQHPVPYYQIGRLLRRQDKPGDAEVYLRRALSIRPDFVDARNELGQVLARQDKLDAAIAEHRRALELMPDDSTTHYHLANALAAEGKRAEAIGSLQEAVRLRSGFWEARYLLGVELAAQDKIKEAQEQFSEVVRLRPDYALGHLNLGVALARQGRIGEAYARFQETLRLDPKNAQAAQHLDTIQRLQSSGRK